MTDSWREWVAAMRDGRHERAWALSDAALAARDPATRDDPSQPYHRRWVWDGRSLDDRAVLVRCYQGLGDTIQFARFLPLLAGRAARVTVEAQPPLLPLLATIPMPADRHPITWVAFDRAAPLPPSACDIEVCELAGALRAAPDAAPPPYLFAVPAPLPPGTIGLCHRAGDWDPARAIPPALLAPLCALAPAIALHPSPSDLPVRNPAGCPAEIGGTAALIAGADLVITVDTMVAHLAGALGRPAWLLLRADPDWRWAPDRATSAWYPATRQYVQPRPGDWASVAARVIADLADARSASRLGR